MGKYKLLPTPIYEEYGKSGRFSIRLGILHLNCPGASGQYIWVNVHACGCNELFPFDLIEKRDKVNETLRNCEI